MADSSKPDTTQVGGKQVANPYSYANITGTASLAVNVFAGDTELDKALRLLRAAVEEVDDAVSDLPTTDRNTTTDAADAPGTNPINTEVSDE